MSLEMVQPSHVNKMVKQLSVRKGLVSGIFEDTQFSELKWQPVSYDIRGLWAGEGPHTSEEITFISGPGRCLLSQ